LIKSAGTGKLADMKDPFKIENIMTTHDESHIIGLLPKRMEGAGPRHRDRCVVFSANILVVYWNEMVEVPPTSSESIVLQPPDTGTTTQVTPTTETATEDAGSSGETQQQPV